MMTSNPFEDDDQFYLWTRAQIEHEDNLINNRMTWLLTLQAFLFGAFGFSISGRATLAAAYIQKHPETALDDKNLLALTSAFVSEARTGLALMACFASVALLVGIAAAAASMERLTKSWETREVKLRARYPQIIGRSFGPLGIYGGLLPTYLLPVLSAVVWTYLTPTWPVVSMLIVVWAFATVGVFYVAGVKRGQLLARKNHPPSSAAP